MLWPDYRVIRNICEIWLEQLSGCIESCWVYISLAIQQPQIIMIIQKNELIYLLNIFLKANKYSKNFQYSILHTN